MTEKQYRKSHEEFMRRIDALDRQCPIDPPESPEEAKWNEERINQVKQHIKMETIGQRLSPVLIEIENTLWEYEVNRGIQPEYTQEGFRAAIKIFMSAIMDKMYDVQTRDGMELEDMEAMANSCGEDLKKFVHTYTGINTLKLYGKA